MLEALKSVRDRWSNRLGEPTTVGIGINSGVARVGNTGSRLKFKYGPLGNTVNVASRVQGVTKTMQCSILVTGDTVRRLDASISRRRLARVQVVNIDQPIDLFEIVRDDSNDKDKDRSELFAAYEAALELLEAKNFARAVRQLGNLAAEFPSDFPVRLLLSRAVNGLVEPEDFDPIWRLLTK
jgi:adenylate cyclase